MKWNVFRLSEIIPSLPFIYGCRSIILGLTVVEIPIRRHTYKREKTFRACLKI